MKKMDGKWICKDCINQQIKLGHDLGSRDIDTLKEPSTLIRLKDDYPTLPVDMLQAFIEYHIRCRLEGTPHICQHCGACHE